MGRPPSVRPLDRRPERGFDISKPGHLFPTTGDRGRREAGLVEQKSGRSGHALMFVWRFRDFCLLLLLFCPCAPCTRRSCVPPPDDFSRPPERNGPSGKGRGGGGGGGCARHRTTTKQEKLPLGLPSPSPPFLAPVPRQMTAGLVRMMTQDRAGRGKRQRVQSCAN